MHQPKNPIYQVKSGDTLWAIAQQQYGDPTVWPQIAKANRVPASNLILVGMKLSLPTIHTKVVGVPKIPGKVNVPTAVAPKGMALPGAYPKARPVMFPAIKYKLDDLKPIAVETPEFSYKLKLIGEMTLQPKGTLSEVEFSQSGGISAKLKSEYATKFASIGNQVSVKLSPDNRVAEVSLGFTVSAKSKGKTLMTTQVQVTPPNKFKFTCKPQEIEGERDGVLFKGVVGYELEITVKKQGGDMTKWVLVGVLVTGAVLIIAADVVKDIGTLGAGLVESPVSFAAAMAMFNQAAAIAR